MADRIKGITIEIGGDTTGLRDALKDTNKEISNTQNQLKDVERLLKLDPSNTDLLSQKQKLLAESISGTKEKLETLKEAEKQAQQQFAEGKISKEQYDALKREIIATEESLKSLENQAAQSNITLQEIGAIGQKFEDVGSKIESAGKKVLPVSTAVTGLGTAAVKVTADFDEVMSKVAAISGATGNEIDQLREKAREMGEKTKFSASEAGEAFTYMAMAGWDAQQMMEGIDGIMNLAAADGLDLATTSDIVTDALTAFGLQASDSAHFADVLAKASSSANTNVSMLGESFKYVAPIAGTLGYSAEDTAVALGLMANAGIKGSQAGTSLRTALTNMASPTKDMVGVMNSLGIEIENANGSMKPLGDLMDDLREKFRITTEEERNQNYAMAEQRLVAEGLGAQLEGLTEEQKRLQIAYYEGIGAVESLSYEELKSQANARLGIELTKERALTEEEYYQLATSMGKEALDGMTQAMQAEAAATLFGKEAMSGMLNVINASEADYQKLTDSIYDCEGTALNMAETMQDNLSGQLTILMSQLQELAISFGEILMPAIRDIVTYIQGFVDGLNGLSDGQKKVIAVIGVLLAAVAPLLIFVGKIAAAIGSIMGLVSRMGPALTVLKAVFAALSGPIGTVIAIIAALVAGFMLLWQTSEDFRNFWIGLWENVKGIAQRVAEELATMFTITIPNAWTKLVAIFNGIPEWWASLWRGIYEKFTEIWNSIMQNPIVQVIVRSIIDRWNNFTETIKSIWNNIRNIADAAWELIKNVILGPVLLLIDLVTGDFENLASDAAKIWTNIRNAAEKIWTNLREMLVTLVLGLLRDMELKFSAIRDLVVKITSDLKDKAVEAFWNLVNGTKEKLVALPGVIRAGFQEAIEFITSLPRLALGWGKDFIQGLIDGIKSKITAIKDAVSEVGENIRSYLHFSRPDTGPLREYESWMPDMMQGLSDGIKGNLWRVTDQIRTLAGVMSLDRGQSLLTGGTNDLTGVESLMGLILSALDRLAGMKIILDDGTIVGKLMPQIDRQMKQYEDYYTRGGIA